MTGSTRWYDAEQLRRISEVTIAHYDRLAEGYWDGTRDHDADQNEEGLSGDRNGYFLDLDTWGDYVTAAGFFQVRHYYRPPGLPRHKQWWLATVWRKG